MDRSTAPHQGSPIDRPFRISVAWKQIESSFACDPSESVLYAGLAAGLGLPYECATGTCGTCKAALLDGEVESAWPEAPGWAGVRRGKGEVLLCQSRPRSDCRFAFARGPAPVALAAPQRYRGRVERSGRLTGDVVLMQLRLDRPLYFAAGQFILLAAPGVPGFRAYSMVNAPDEGSLIELIAKRKPDGRLSDVLFSNVLHDVEFDVFGPLGRAVLDPQGAGDLLVVAGGTGIAGPLSILQSASHSGHLDTRRAAVYFGVRREADLFFLDRLSSLQQRHDATLEVTVAISDERPGAALARAHPGLRFVGGLVHEALAAHPSPDLASPTAYLAGPQLAVDAATRMVMSQLKLAPERILFDRFG